MWRAGVVGTAGAAWARGGEGEKPREGPGGEASRDSSHEGDGERDPKLGGEARSMEEAEPEGEGVVRGPGCEAADSTTGTMAEGSGRGSLETNTLRLDGGVALRRGARGDCRSSRERPVRTGSMCPMEKLRPRVAGPGFGVRGAPEEHQ